jgi:hypothetical protein
MADKDQDFIQIIHEDTSKDCVKTSGKIFHAYDHNRKKKFVLCGIVITIAFAILYTLFLIPQDKLPFNRHHDDETQFTSLEEIHESKNKEVAIVIEDFTDSEIKGSISSHVNIVALEIYSNKKKFFESNSSCVTPWFNVTFDETNNTFKNVLTIVKDVSFAQTFINVAIIEKSAAFNFVVPTYTFKKTETISRLYSLSITISHSEGNHTILDKETSYCVQELYF